MATPTLNTVQHKQFDKHIQHALVLGGMTPTESYLSNMFNRLFQLRKRSIRMTRSLRMTRHNCTNWPNMFNRIFQFCMRSPRTTRRQLCQLTLQPSFTSFGIVILSNRNYSINFELLMINYIIKYNGTDVDKMCRYHKNKLDQYLYNAFLLYQVISQ